MEVGRALEQVVFGGGVTEDEAVQLVWKPIPREPSPGHVIVRMLMSVINPVDIAFIRESRLRSKKDAGGTAVLGSEGVGTIYEVGEGVTAFRKGERVVPVIYWNYLLGKGQGAWQDFIEVAEDLAIPKGEFLLQAPGGSVIGRLVIQLAKHWGIKTINLIRREELREELLELGADEVINSTREDVVAKVFEITQGKGAYAGIDAISGISTKVIAASICDYGDLFVYGTMSSPDVVVSARDLMRKVNVTFWNLTRFLNEEQKRGGLLVALPQLFEAQVMTPLVGKKFPLSEFKAAMHESLSSQSCGKVLLVH